MYSGLALGCFCMTFCHVCYSNFSSFYILIYPLKKMFGLESCPPPVFHYVTKIQTTQDISHSVSVSFKAEPCVYGTRHIAHTLLSGCWCYTSVSSASCVVLNWQPKRRRVLLLHTHTHTHMVGHRKCVLSHTLSPLTVILPSKTCSWISITIPQCSRDLLLSLNLT